MLLILKYLNKDFMKAYLMVKNWEKNLRPNLIFYYLWCMFEYGSCSWAFRVRPEIYPLFKEVYLFNRDASALEILCGACCGSFLALKFLRFLEKFRLPKLNFDLGLFEILDCFFKNLVASSVRSITSCPLTVMTWNLMPYFL